MKFYRRQADRTTGTRFASRALSAQTRKRPTSVLRDHGVRRSREASEALAEFVAPSLLQRHTGIPQRDASISHDAAPFRALDRATAKDAAKFFLGQRGQPFQAGLKKRFCGRGHAALPRHL